MLEPVGGKSTWNTEHSYKLRCPSRSHPFIATYLNSQDDFDVDDGVCKNDVKIRISKL